MSGTVDYKRLSVKFRSWDWGVNWNVIEECGGIYGGRTVPQLRLITVEAPEGASLEAVRARLEASSEVERAGYPIIPERRSYHAPTGNDTYLDLAWQLKRMNVYHAWKYTKGNPAIRVAAVDTGLVGVGLEIAPPDYAYQSAGAIVGNADDWGYNNSEGIPVSDYYYSHGTNVWSAIKSKSNDAKGASGVCPDVFGIMVALSDSGDSWPNIPGALVAAADAGAKLMSLSWGWSANVDPDNTASVLPLANRDVIEAIQYAQSLGCIVFAAAGNFSEYYSATNQTSPARNYIPNDMNGVVNVSGVAGADAAHYDDPLTNPAWGPGIDIVVPGADVFLTNCGTIAMPAPLYGWGGYNTYRNELGALANLEGPAGAPRHGSGYATGPQFVHVSTSFASPLAMGVAALIWSINPALTGAEVVAILKETAGAGRHPSYASKFPATGIANAGKGVAKARSTLAANAGVPIPYLGFSGVGAVTVVADGVATTNLDNTVYVDVAGFCSDQITSVELWLGTIQIYAGPPVVLAMATSSAGTPQTLKVVANTTGATTEEIYTDVVVSSMMLAETTVELVGPLLGQASAVGVLTYTVKLSGAVPSHTDVSGTLTQSIGHLLRAEAGGVPVYATTLPGTQFPVSAHLLRVETEGSSLYIIVLPGIELPASTATTTAAQALLSSSLPLPAAALLSEAGETVVTSIDLHCLKVSAGGPALYVYLRPGVDNPSAQIRTEVSSLAISAQTTLFADTGHLFAAFPRLEGSLATQGAWCFSETTLFEIFVSAFFIQDGAFSISSVVTEMSMENVIFDLATCFVYRGGDVQRGRTTSADVPPRAVQHVGAVVISK